MKHRWISFTATCLAALHVQACTSWTVSREPLEQIAGFDEAVRIDTDEIRNLELQYPFATEDTLYGMVSGSDRSDSLAKAGLARIPYRDVPGAPVALARSSVVATYVYRPSEGWVEIANSLDNVIEGEGYLAVVLRDGSDLGLTNWQATPDSLLGIRKRREFASTEWVAVPRSAIDQVAVQRSDVGETIGLGLLVVGGALAVVLVVALATSGSFEVGGGFGQH